MQPRALTIYECLEWHIRSYPYIRLSWQIPAAAGSTPIGFRLSSLFDFQKVANALLCKPTATGPMTSSHSPPNSAVQGSRTRVLSRTLSDKLFLFQQSRKSYTEDKSCGNEVLLLRTLSSRPNCISGPMHGIWYLTEQPPEVKPLPPPSPAAKLTITTAKRCY